MPMRPTRDCDGITRRSLVQAGLAGTIGLSFADLLRLRAQAETAGRHSAVIYIELAGGPTQHETYDPKPIAPEEYRGPLQAVSTSLPGVRFSELMAEQARIADKLAVIRSITHDSSSHGTSSHLTQTGYYLSDRQNRDNEMPCVGSITAKVRGAGARGMPAFVSLPRSMRYGRAAWLGKGYSPFETGRNADDRNFRVPNLTLIDGVPADRLENRRALLEGFDQTRRIIDNRGVAEALDDFERQAFEMVTGRQARVAFDIDQEDERIRAQYGNNGTGQNLLLARRLVERGVTFVTVRVGGWDDHNQIERRMRQKGPDYDRGVAALVEDLHQRGLAADVLVVAMGEFGRTPRVNRNAGRDHWGRLMSVLLAGGGLRTGQVVGASDRTGSTVVEAPYRPEHVLATIYHHLGIDTSQTFVDHSGRPRYVLEERELVSELV